MTVNSKGISAAAPTSDDKRREDVLQRSFDFAISDILALPTNPSGFVQATRNFSFEGYEVTIQARCGQAQDHSRTKRAHEDSEESVRLSPDELLLRNLEVTVLESEEGKTLWKEVLQRPLVLRKLEILLDISTSPTISTIQAISPDYLYEDISSSLARLELANSKTSHLSVIPLTTIPLLPTIQSICSARSVTVGDIPSIMKYISRDQADMSLVPISLGRLDDIPQIGSGLPIGTKSAGKILKNHALAGSTGVDMVGGYLEVDGRYVAWMTQLSTKKLVLADKGWSEETIMMVLLSAIKHAYPQAASGASEDWTIISGSHASINPISVMLRTLLAIKIHGMRVPSAIETGPHESNEIAAGAWCLNLLEDAASVTDGYQRLVKRVNSVIANED